jgi:hypothetical protein
MMFRSRRTYRKGQEELLSRVLTLFNEVLKVMATASEVKDVLATLDGKLDAVGSKIDGLIATQSGAATQAEVDELKVAADALIVKADALLSK